VNLISEKRKSMIFRQDTNELIWRAAIGLGLFILAMVALTIKGQ